MKTRYFVAIAIPAAISQKLHDYYLRTYRKELSVKNIHISLIPPFFLKDGVEEKVVYRKIAAIEFSKYNAKFTELGIFKQIGKKLLYAKAEPGNEFELLARKVGSGLEGLIEIDTSPYTDGVVPIFEAHSTLDYDFSGEIATDWSELSFVVDKLVCYRGENGVWTIGF